MQLSSQQEKEYRTRAGRVEALRQMAAQQEKQARQLLQQSQEYRTMADLLERELHSVFLAEVERVLALDSQRNYRVVEGLRIEVIGDGNEHKPGDGPGRGNGGAARAEADAAPDSGSDGPPPSHAGT